MSLALVPPNTLPPKTSPPASARRHTRTLSIRGVSKSYQIEGRCLPVLQGIDLEAPPGSFISIVGASGCGKSTLLRLIVGLDDNFDGEIRLGDVPVSGTSTERGIVFQEHRLFPWLTVAQNVAVGLGSRRIAAAEKAARVAEHIRLVGLEGFEGAYPHQLSGGMSQRTAIARALIGKPEILLLDEPLGALDALTRLHLQNELQRLWRVEGVTVLMVTHDIEEAVFLGQEVIVMDARPGRVRRRLPVPLAYPRDRIDPAFVALKQSLLAEFHVGETPATANAGVDAGQGEASSSSVSSVACP